MPASRQNAPATRRAMAQMNESPLAVYQAYLEQDELAYQWYKEPLFPVAGATRFGGRSVVRKVQVSDQEL